MYCQVTQKGDFSLEVKKYTKSSSDNTTATVYEKYFFLLKIQDEL